MEYPPNVAIVIREGDDSRMYYEVSILVSYKDEGSNDMVGVEAIADVRKLYPEATISYIVEERDQVRSTILRPSDEGGVYVLPVKD